MFDRRAYLALLGALGFAGAVAPLNASFAAQRRFDPRTGQYTFMRTLVRNLPDGEVITVTRSFDVEIATHSTGYAIDGTQKSVTVDVPPALEALAELERKREEANLFPISLDRNGLIAAGPRATGTMLTVEAVRVALTKLETEGPEAASASDSTFLRYVQDSLGEVLSRLPADLFAPIPAPIHETRQVALPDGTVGTVALHYLANAHPTTGLLTDAKREVTTQLAGSTRNASESWSLSPAF